MQIHFCTAKGTVQECSVHLFPKLERVQMPINSKVDT